jgi:hypothetical protein
MKTCSQIFEAFRECDIYPQFPLMKDIEKRVKINYYQDHTELAADVRKIIQGYFSSSVSDPEKYSNTFKFSEAFESIYRDYEIKKFTKESKYIIDMKKKMNRLKRDMKERSTPTNSSKLKIDVNDYQLYNNEKKISKKYKLDLVNNIRSLNQEQVKGIINIIHDCLNLEQKTMEFDVNKLPLHKLKELDKYVKNCLKNKNNPLFVTPFSDRLPLTPNNSITKNFKESINVNININNNFMMGENKLLQSISAKPEEALIVENELMKKNSILSDSDSLSSDDDSGKIIF